MALPSIIFRHKPHPPARYTCSSVAAGCSSGGSSASTSARPSACNRSCQSRYALLPYLAVCRKVTFLQVARVHSGLSISIKQSAVQEENSAPQSWPRCVWRELDPVSRTCMENANILWEGGPESSAPHGLVERRDLVDPAAHRLVPRGVGTRHDRPILTLVTPSLSET